MNDQTPNRKNAGAGESHTTGASADSESILREFADSTARVVGQAASILEDEISAGILAAKKLERRFIKVDELRSGSPQDVVQRFRRDAHEVVDILVDLVTSATRTLGDVTSRIVQIRTTRSTAPGPAEVGMPTLKPLVPVKPGASAELPMLIENDGAVPSSVGSFHCSDLVSTTGERILSTNMTCQPASLTVPAGAAEKVIITVTVPPAALPGTYSGLLQASNLQQVRAIIVVQVAE